LFFYIYGINLICLCLSDISECTILNSCNQSSKCIDFDRSFFCESCETYQNKPCNSFPICQQNTCGIGFCQEIGASFICHCPDNYFGLHCEQVTPKECKLIPCENEGICHDFENSSIANVQCNCIDGWKGKFCQISFEFSCRANPCYDGGLCTYYNDTYKCICPDYPKGKPRGLNCEIETACHSSPCWFNSTCVTLAVDNFLCLCTPNYTGIYCETELTSTSTTMFTIKSSGIFTNICIIALY
jgi:protein crumbs